MSILSIFDKFDHNNKIHNHIDNILHNFSSFFFNDFIVIFYYYCDSNYYENCKIDLHIYYNKILII